MKRSTYPPRRRGHVGIISCMTERRSDYRRNAISVTVSLAPIFVQRNIFAMRYAAGEPSVRACAMLKGLLTLFILIVLVVVGLHFVLH